MSKQNYNQKVLLDHANAIQQINNTNQAINNRITAEVARLELRDQDLQSSKVSKDSPESTNFQPDISIYGTQPNDNNPYRFLLNDLIKYTETHILANTNQGKIEALNNLTNTLIGIMQVLQGHVIDNRTMIQDFEAQQQQAHQILNAKNLSQDQALAAAESRLNTTISQFRSIYDAKVQALDKADALNEQYVVAMTQQLIGVIRQSDTNNAIERSVLLKMINDIQASMLVNTSAGGKYIDGSVQDRDTILTFDQASFTFRNNENPLVSEAGQFIVSIYDKANPTAGAKMTELLILKEDGKWLHNDPQFQIASFQTLENVRWQHTAIDITWDDNSQTLAKKDFFYYRIPSSAVDLTDLENKTRNMAAYDASTQTTAFGEKVAAKEFILDGAEISKLIKDLQDVQIPTTVQKDQLVKLLSVIYPTEDIKTIYFLADKLVVNGDLELITNESPEIEGGSGQKMPESLKTIITELRNAKPANYDEVEKFMKAITTTVDANGQVTKVDVGAPFEFHNGLKVDGKDVEDTFDLIETQIKNLYIPVQTTLTVHPQQTVYTLLKGTTHLDPKALQSRHLIRIPALTDTTITHIEISLNGEIDVPVYAKWDSAAPSMPLPLEEMENTTWYVERYSADRYVWVQQAGDSNPSDQLISADGNFRLVFGGNSEATGMVQMERLVNDVWEPMVSWVSAYWFSLFRQQILDGRIVVRDAFYAKKLLSPDSKTGLVVDNKGYASIETDQKFTEIHKGQATGNGEGDSCYNDYDGTMLTVAGGTGAYTVVAKDGTVVTSGTWTNAGIIRALKSYGDYIYGASTTNRVIKIKKSDVSQFEVITYAGNITNARFMEFVYTGWMIIGGDAGNFSLVNTVPNDQGIYESRNGNTVGTWPNTLDGTNVTVPSQTVYAAWDAGDGYIRLAQQNAHVITIDANAQVIHAQPVVSNFAHPRAQCSGNNNKNWFIVGGGSYAQKFERNGLGVTQLTQTAIRIKRLDGTDITSNSAKMVDIPNRQMLLCTTQATGEYVILDYNYNTLASGYMSDEGTTPAGSIWGPAVWPDSTLFVGAGLNTPDNKWKIVEITIASANILTQFDAETGTYFNAKTADYATNAGGLSSSAVAAKSTAELGVTGVTTVNVDGKPIGTLNPTVFLTQAEYDALVAAGTWIPGVTYKVKGSSISVWYGTQAEYDALSDEEKNNGTDYFTESEDVVTRNVTTVYTLATLPANWKTIGKRISFKLKTTGTWYITTPEYNMVSFLEDSRFRAWHSWNELTGAVTYQFATDGAKPGIEVVLSPSDGFWGATSLTIDKIFLTT